MVYNPEAHVRDGAYRAARPGRSIADLHPELVKQWDPDGNGDATPDKVAAGCNVKASWICPRGKRQPLDIVVSNKVAVHRRGGTCCKSCAAELAAPGRSLAELDPDLVASFDPVASAPATAVTACARGNLRWTWRCSEPGHPVWPATVKQRKRDGCPTCASVGVLRPDLAAQWHPDNELTPLQVKLHSATRVRWRCQVGHEWATTTSLRHLQNTGCPDCQPWGVSRAQLRLLAELVTVLAPHLKGTSRQDLKAGRLRNCREARLDGVPQSQGPVDILLRPSGLGADGHSSPAIALEYDGAYYHRQRVPADTLKSGMIRQAGYRLLRVREHPLGSLHPDDVVVPQNAPPYIVAALVLEALRERGWVPGCDAAVGDYLQRTSRRRRGRLEVATDLADRLLQDTEHPDPGEHSLQVIRPDLAPLWHPSRNGRLTAALALASDTQRRWWLCPFGDEFDYTVAELVRAEGRCPVCSGKRVNERTCLATTHPHLVADWPTLTTRADGRPTEPLDWPDGRPFGPYDVSAGCSFALRWECATCQHRWTVQVKQRARLGSGCPACAGKMATATNNLLVLHARLVEVLWAYDLNARGPREYRPQSNAKVWWRCPCGHQWEATISDRVRANLGCRDCSRRGRASRHGHVWENGAAPRCGTA